MDKFLIKHAFNDNFDDYKTHLIGWKEGKEKDAFLNKLAFDYKVKINSSDTSPMQINKFPLYFGNLSDDGDKIEKKFMFSNKPLSIVFTSFNSVLLDKINLHFKEFLFNTNFGSRQSKGFGSFYLDGFNLNDVPTSKTFKFSIDLRLKKDNRANEKLRSYGDFEKIFTKIELLYKSLRSGINDIGPNNTPRFYFKPMMFRFALKYEIQWDKKTIKQHYFNEDLEDQREKHENNYPDILEYSSIDALMKEVLGLSTTEKWEIPYKKTITKEHINYKKDKKIERFKSPITFKPIQRNDSGVYDVFILTEPINKEFLGQEFAVKAGGNGDLTMFTPSAFNIESFLEFAFTEVNLKEHVKDEEHRKRWQYKILEPIYNEIKQNIEAYHG